MVNEQYLRAKRILTENGKGHNALADMLVEREVIFADDLAQVFGKRQWTSRTDEIVEAQKKVDAAEALANAEFNGLVEVKTEEPAAGAIAEVPASKEPEVPETPEDKTKA